MCMYFLLCKSGLNPSKIVNKEIVEKKGDKQRGGP